MLLEPVPLRRHAESAAPLPEALRRYFRPGVNWAGRTIYGIPVFGFALIGMSQGAYAITDAWVLLGLVLFVALALLAECVLWPAERRLQQAVTSDRPRAAGPDPVRPTALSEAAVADAARMERVASGALILLAAATVLMIAQP